ncbi:hypothetical protein EVAR_45650_1 [Eumeta japonica]|uniref:Uncharacterized protein n=1 Tax=Eumeta variegata TaxID=151549 RepID=A0A4C1Y4U8_EUMVA|nr:hypothetical protein EVAR_45650_1 [Eumeta japonica]
MGKTIVIVKHEIVVKPCCGRLGYSTEMDRLERLDTHFRKRFIETFESCCDTEHFRREVAGRGAGGGAGADAGAHAKPVS